MLIASRRFPALCSVYHSVCNAYRICMLRCGLDLYLSTLQAMLFLGYHSSWKLLTIQPINSRGSLLLQSYINFSPFFFSLLKGLLSRACTWLLNMCLPPFFLPSFPTSAKLCKDRNIRWKKQIRKFHSNSISVLTCSLRKADPVTAKPQSSLNGNHTACKRQPCFDNLNG